MLFPELTLLQTNHILGDQPVCKRDAMKMKSFSTVQQNFSPFWLSLLPAVDQRVRTAPLAAIMFRDINRMLMDVDGYVCLSHFLIEMCLV